MNYQFISTLEKSVSHAEFVLAQESPRLEAFLKTILNSNTSFVYKRATMRERLLLQLSQLALACYPTSRDANTKNWKDLFTFT
jgi:hypothetical protein